MRFHWQPAVVEYFRIAQGGRITKWRGTVASMAPAVLAIGALLFAAPGVAQAGTCTRSGNTITCTGAPDPAGKDPINSFTLTQAAPIQVQFDAGAGINRTNMTGFALRIHTGAQPTGLTIDASQAALIAGRNTAINVQTYNGKGNIKITTGGPIESLFGRGIHVTTGGQVDDLEVTANGVIDVESAQEGVRIEHKGKGNTKLTLNAKVTSANGTGVYLGAGANTGDLLLLAGDNIEGGKYGVQVVRTGKGDTDVVLKGDVTGGANAGVQVNTSGNTLDTTLTVDGVVNGKTYGVQVQNNGKGDTTVTLRGKVTSATNDAIYVTSGANTGNADITAKDDVTGKTFGVRLVHSGSGNASILLEGVVSGATSDGVFLNAGANTQNADIVARGNVSGNNYGIRLVHSGKGNAGVQAEGNVTATTNAGIFVNAGANTGDAIIIAKKDVSGGTYGVQVTHSGTGNTEVTVDGNVVAAANAGIYVNSAGNTADAIITARGNVTGKTFGVQVNHTGKGNTSVTLEGLVTGTSNAGVIVTSSANTQDATIVAKGDVEGNTYGIQFTHTGKGDTSVTTLGKVTGNTNVGIYVNGGATTKKMTITTASDVMGNTFGIQAVHNGSDVLTITVDGNVKSVANAAISTVTKVGNTTNLTINKGTIESDADVAILNNAGDSNIDIMAAAVVKGDIKLGAGSDNLNIQGADVSQVTLFDGGDDTKTGDGYIDELKFQGVTLNNANAGIFKNWEVITLANSTVNLASGTMGAGQLKVGAGSTLGFAGADVTIAGNVTNDGIITSQDGNPDDSLTIEGDYDGGGTIKIDAYLADDANTKMDKVVINGDNKGDIKLEINNTGGPGGPISDLKFVDVKGANNGTIALANGPLVAGAFVYDVDSAGNLLSKPAGGAVQGATGLLQLLPAGSLSFTERLASTWAFSPSSGGRMVQTAGFSITPTAATPVDMVSGLWLRGHYRYLKADADVDVAGMPDESTTKMNRLWMQLGYTHRLMANADGVLAGSFFGQYKRTTMKTSTASGSSGRTAADGFGGGGSLTWLGQNGFYGDLYGEVTRHRMKVRDNATSATGKVNVTTWQLSVESGYRIPIAERLNLIPQAQIIVSGSKFKSFNVGSLSIRGDSSTRVNGRFGAAVELVNLPLGEDALLTTQFTASWLHDFSGKETMQVNGQQITSKLARDLIELRTTTTIGMMGSGVAFMLENNFRHSLRKPKQYSFKTSIGVKASF